MDSLKNGRQVDIKSMRMGTLNPNAAEFFPFAQTSKSVNSITDISNCSHGITTAPPSGYSISNTLDEHSGPCRHYQLPDDIIPDFSVLEKEEHKQQDLSLSALSLTDEMEAWRFSTPLELKCMPFSRQELPRISLIDEFIHPAEGNDLLSDLNVPTENEVASGNNILDPLEFLRSQFPDFASQSLADVYFANGNDLVLTIEMLARLELQLEGNNDRNGSPEVVSVPDLTTMDFPALPVSHCRPDQLKNNADASKIAPTGALNSLRPEVDFASVAKNGASLEKGTGNSKTPLRRGSSRRRADEGRSVFREKLNSRPTPVWLETGDAVASLYSELRGEARDHARVRNAYFEQATKAYLVGNNAMAKELSYKGQMHNLKMKVAHDKAQKSIYKQRNGMGVEGGRKEGLIDLHGLHVSEAIRVLKQELPLLAKEARLQVYVCVGTGHHTRGSRTPARLPVAVQQYLLQEGVQYTEPHPGLLLISL